MAYCAPTDAEVREYISGYYEQHEDCERFKIKAIGESPEGPLCRDVEVYTEWQNGDNVGNDTTYVETVTWTVWLEDDGTVYGEH